MVQKPLSVEVDEEGAGVKLRWGSVISALEKTLGEYDRVNEVISWGRADELRDLALRRFQGGMMHLVLDAGVGPGNMAEKVLRLHGDASVVGLDGSRKMLRAAFKVRSKGEGRLELLQGVFERLPFKRAIFDLAVCGYSFRDAMDKRGSLKEFRRILKRNGRLLIIDVGKPDDPVLHSLMWVYMHFAVPLLASFFGRRGTWGNPWTWLSKTYDHLWRNSRFKDEIQSLSYRVSIHSFMFGCMIILEALKA